MEQFKPKNFEAISENIINTIKEANFDKNQINELISKLQDIKLEDQSAETKSVESVKNESKADAEKLQSKGEVLLGNFPEYQPNTRTEITQQILDYAAEIYNVSPYEQGIESGKYISWLQELGNEGYFASQALNQPKKAMVELMKYISKMK